MVKGIAPKLRWKKKNWIAITAPEMFNEEEIGRTVSMENEKVIGRNVVVNAFTLTKDPRKQNKKITLKINKVEGEKARTFVHAYEMMTAHIRRLIRKNGSRIDINTNIKTKDNSTVNIKILMFTSTRCQNTQKKDLRVKAEEELRKSVLEMDYNTFVNSVINSKLQKDIRAPLKKIHPVKTLEITKFKKLN